MIGEAVRENYRRQGEYRERQRIIKILNDWVDAGHFEDCFQDKTNPDPDDCVCFSRRDADHIIDLINGGNA